MRIILMGVSGCGKSTIGALLGEKTNLHFYDGDDFHPAKNINKMSSGIPLTDEDRNDWLHVLHNKILAKNNRCIIACSALKPEYRKILSEGFDDIYFIYLKADYKLILERHKNRKDHFFSGEAMLKSQFNTLVEPQENEADIVDISQTPEKIVEIIIDALKI